MHSTVRVGRQAKRDTVQVDRQANRRTRGEGRQVDSSANVHAAKQVPDHEGAKRTDG